MDIRKICPFIPLFVGAFDCHHRVRYQPCFCSRSFNGSKIDTPFTYLTPTPPAWLIFTRVTRYICRTPTTTTTTTTWKFANLYKNYPLPLSLTSKIRKMDRELPARIFNSRPLPLTRLFLAHSNFNSPSLSWTSRISRFFRKLESFLIFG